MGSLGTSCLKKLGVWIILIDTYLTRLVQMGNKHMKRSPKSLVIRQVQIKSTMRCLLIPISMVIIFFNTIKMEPNMWKICSTNILLVGTQNGVVTWGNSLEVSQNVKHFNPAILLIGICLRKLKSCVYIVTYRWLFIEALFIKAKRG